MAASAHLLLPAHSKRPDSGLPENGSLESVPRPVPALVVVPEQIPHEDLAECACFSTEANGIEPPLTSEPPLADAVPLTSEPSLAGIPLTSEPAAIGLVADADPSVA
ncbi:hypothetical protein [Streptomyces sp. NPDC058045]|uniref:hypothetical protein n=1 Tax=Streptomyces sp. NPDC058045 TaxID=3346311 RepID=UPI0036E76909